jgi:hypothetical protein
MPENTLGGNLHTGVSGTFLPGGRRFNDADVILGWARYMEWMYPVEVRFTNKGAFRAAGAVEAAATL